jgi:hypothetical protein
MGRSGASILYKPEIPKFKSFMRKIGQIRHNFRKLSPLSAPDLLDSLYPLIRIDRS